jgi:Na+-driven multidrug efflux pump
MLLGGLVTRKMLSPIYREAPPAASRANFLKLRKMRTLVTGSLLLLVGIAAALGPWLVSIMYDPRYAAAGSMVTLMACMQVPLVTALTYDQAALAAGDSKRFFILAFARAALMLVCLLIGLETAGLVGGILAQGTAWLLSYPVVVWLARRMKVWDPVHDLLSFAAGACIAAITLTLNWTSVTALAAS